MRLRFFFVSVTVAGLVAACRSAAPVPAALPPPVQPILVAAPAPIVDTWRYRPTVERRAFVLSQRAVVTIKQDTTTRVDTVTSRAEVNFGTANARIAGSITAFLAGGAGRELAPVAGVRFPVVLAASIPASGAQLAFSAPLAASPCEAPATTVAHSVRDLWFRSPDTLRVGTTWSDSARYAICRDGIPLQLHVIRDFRVTRSVERDGQIVLTVVRASRTALTGEGDQFGERVSVMASGTGALTYEIAPLSGELLGAQGTSALDLTFRSALRTQQARQTADILLARLP